MRKVLLFTALIIVMGFIVPQTLNVAYATEHTVVGNVFLGAGPVRGESVFLTGMGMQWVVDGTVGLGLQFCGSRGAQSTLTIDYVFGTAEYQLDVNEFGTEIEFYFRRDKTINYSFGGFIGIGRIRAEPEGGGDDSYDTFLSIKPEFSIGINKFEIIHPTLLIAYRITDSISLYNLENGDFNGLIIGMNLKIGKI